MYKAILTCVSLALSTAALADCDKNGRGPDCSRPRADFIIGSSAGFTPRARVDVRRKRPTRSQPAAIPAASAYANLQRRVDALVAAKDCNGAKAMALNGG